MASRARQQYHQEKNQPLSVQFQKFSNYQMRNSYVIGVGITHLIIRKFLKLYRKSYFFLVIYLCIDEKNFDNQLQVTVN